MNEHVQKLISIGSEALGTFEEGQHSLTGTVIEEIYEMLSKKCGFFAFESALHVYLVHSRDKYLNLVTWNKQDTWRYVYGEMAKDLFFFAQDVFGVQHCVKDNSIYSFDPETGKLELLANSLGDWARRILTESNYLTGYSLAHEWQSKFGKLGREDRLMPKTPFICAGEFEIANLCPVEARESMIFRGDIAMQIKDLPDGAKFELEFVD